ncbi:MAG: F0F1 ATP synthase subunit delta [Chthoniobacterales bacterium]
MKISREAQRNARKLFDASLVDGRLDHAISLAAAETIVTAKPRYFFQILKEFVRLTRLELDRHQAVIQSAVPLNDSSQMIITNALKARDPQVEISVVVNPSLIGGTRIRLGSDVWDGTILSRLEKIQAA